MSNDSDDEIFSAIIDGDSSAESLALVEANPEKAKRLQDMQRAVELVAEAPAAATPEQRTASIGAALAVATSASPEVASLTAQRHKQNNKPRSLSRRALAVAAAVMLLFVGVPVLFGRVGNTTEQLASVSADESADIDSAMLEAANQERASDDQGNELAVEDQQEEAATGNTMAAQANTAQDESADALADTELESVVINTPVVQSIDELDQLIAAGLISPVLAGEDLLARDAPVARSGEPVDEALATSVNPQCLTLGDPTAPATFDLAVLDPFAGAAELVLIEFIDEETTRVLNAETCEVIR